MQQVVFFEEELEGHGRFMDALMIERRGQDTLRVWFPGDRPAPGLNLDDGLDLDMGEPLGFVC
jgi:hypothetical protein